MCFLIYIHTEICFLCGVNKATDKHHLFSQSKVNKKLYRELIHHPNNIMMLCNDCHLNKTVPKFTEEEFCKAVGIEPKSKIAAMRKKRG